MKVHADLCFVNKWHLYVINRLIQGYHVQESSFKNINGFLIFNGGYTLTDFDSHFISFTCYDITRDFWRAYSGNMFRTVENQCLFWASSRQCMYRIRNEAASNIKYLCILLIGSGYLDFHILTRGPGATSFTWATIPITLIKSALQYLIQNILTI